MTECIDCAPQLDKRLNFCQTFGASNQLLTVDLYQIFVVTRYETSKKIRVRAQTKDGHERTACENRKIHNL